MGQVWVEKTRRLDCALISSASLSPIHTPRHAGTHCLIRRKSGYKHCRLDWYQCDWTSLTQSITLLTIDNYPARLEANMNKSTLSITQHGAVRQILLDRPEALNALNGQMTDDLTDAFLEAQQDDQVKVVLLSGAGRAFWAGADLMEMGSGRAETRHTFQDLMMSLIEFSKPLLIAVNGVGVGIGATICGMADAVFMSDQASCVAHFPA